ncbi:MAG: CsgG/HfaB family protein [Candidatus Competibacter sp.]|nr:CsgG/HfaB family protein [Candidatus Competibacter sp.]
MTSTMAGRLAGGGGEGVDRVILKLLKPMLALLFVLASWLPELALAADKPPERMTATVIEFAVRGGLNEQAGAIIADLMMSAIANTGRFTLKDRLPLSAAAKIAKAQEFGSTGLLDPKTAAELGRLYGVDAVVTGGVYKLGDLITVTARLIDTKTASLLRSGQIQGKDIDTIQIKVNELAAMITAPPPVAPTYALTVKTDPPSANVRLLNSPTPYQPGVRLPSGNYDIEVTQSGYATRKESVRIADRDVALNIALEKAKYGLTVRSEPVDAQIRLLNSPIAYQPGVQLVPGDYQLEVTRDGYASRKFPLKIVDSEVTVPVTLSKLESPRLVQYRLTVQADPPQAKVRLLNEKTEYRPRVELAPGSYTVEVSQSGYETRQVAVRIVDSDVTVPVALTKQPEPERPTLYRLTVHTEPANARIRLLGIRPSYQPGIQLAPGSYTVEVSQSGYETRQVAVRIVDSDVTVPVALTKQPEPEQPTLYRLTVRADPANARIRLLGIRPSYQPGIQLAPGSYTVEVSQSGYETRQVAVRIVDSDVTVPVALVKQPEPSEYQLTVRADPGDAQVRLRGIRATYRPGVRLPPGNYTVEVSRSGYETKQVAVRIVDGDVTVPVALVKQPELAQYRLLVRPTPSNARVRLVDSSFTYRSGMKLPPGSYTVEVSRSGYETKQMTARIVDGDVTLPVTLERTASVTPPSTPSTPSTPSALPSRAGAWQIGSVHVDGWLSGGDRSEVMRVLNGYVGRTVTRQTLLNGAMQVYRTTGVTLSFVVRNSASGSADLSARIAGRTRRTYESSVPLITPSQLENAGFGVSVE